MTEKNRQIRKATSANNAPADSLHWHESLFIRFVALGLISWLVFVLISAWVTQQAPVKNPGDESSQRMGLSFDLITQQAQTLAGRVVQLSLNPAEGLAGVRTNVPKLIERSADADLLAAVGVWPLPNTLDPARERASLIWLQDGGGTFQLREDYNDPRTVPYIHEKWFTPSRYSPRDRCYWTPAYQEPLTRRQISTCTLPIRGPQGFIGAVTVSLNLDAVAKKLAGMNGADHGDNLLVTHGGEVLAAIGTLDIADGASQNIRNLAELARTQAWLSPLALRLHQEHEETVRAIGLSSEQVSALRNETRDMSREEAESALAMLALTPPTGEVKPSTQKLDLKNDSLLRGAATANLFFLPGQWWVLIQITPGDFLLSGFGRNLLSASSPALSMLIFVVLMLWLLRSWVLNPLRQMTEQMAATASARDATHHLDDRPRNELGSLAHWHNESLRHLQRQLEQLRVLRTQQPAEHGERRSPQEAELKARERTALALQSVADGVIILNEQGRVEDMNLAAERFTGVSLRAATGKAFGEIFNARPQQDGQEPLPDLARIARQLTTPMECPQELRLLSAKGETCNIRLSFIPILAQPGHSAGCIAVFRRNSAGTHADVVAAEPHMLDSMTGMPMRDTCESHLRELINQARLTSQQHVLLFIDVDHLKNINDTQGQHAGDDVISQIGNILISVAREDSRAYRLYGDQFAIILRKTNPAHARAYAELLCGRFAGSALRGQASNFRITLSIGIAMADGASSTPSEIIRRSELACAEAKRAGRNRAQEWIPSLEEPTRQADDTVWLNRIRAGLEQDMFHLTTQRIAPMPAKAAEGPAYQMLMALEDEEGFWSTTHAFMPTAQRHELTHEMDRWLINRTIAHLQQSLATLENMSFVGIQLSETAISDNSLLEYLVKFFTENPEVPARKFCFEFSEYALQKNPRQTLTFCEVMRNLGCHLCIDGFAGRRTSDIAQLRKLPIDFIRIDAAQFPNLETDPIELMLTESLMRLARSLNKRIIVSNLETSAQLQAWQQLGPDYLQGSAVAKPSPVVFFGV